MSKQCVATKLNITWSTVLVTLCHFRYSCPTLEQL